MHIIVWILGAISGFILWNKIKWLAILVIILAISYSVNPLEQRRFKEKGSYDNVTATRLGITFALVVGIFIFSLFQIKINKKLSNNSISNNINTNYSFNENENSNFKKLSVDNSIVENINSVSNKIETKCPEDYLSDEERNNDLKKYLSDYIEKYPNATIGDVFNSRYSFLVENDCLKTLEYIKTQANGEDPKTSYIRKNIEELSNKNISAEDKKCEETHGPSIYKEYPQSLGGGAYCDCKPGYTLKITTLSDGTPSSWCFAN